MVKYFRLGDKGSPWGDYGNILVSGMTAHLGRENGLLQLERTGPFLPSIVQSGIGDLIVADSFRKKILQENFAFIEFRPVIKKHIVFVDWTAWDLNAEEPAFYPESGEPEDYILGQPHSKEIAEQMEDVWEVIVPYNGRMKNKNLKKVIPGEKACELMRIEDTGWFMVTDAMKKWLENNGADRFVYEEMEIDKE